MCKRLHFLAGDLEQTVVVDHPRKKYAWLVDDNKYQILPIVLNCLDNLVLTLNGESLLRICLERPHSKLSRNANKVLVRILQCCSQC